MSTTTYVVRVNNNVIDARNSGTMVYTHAVTLTEAGAVTVTSYHTSEANAVQQARSNQSNKYVGTHGRYGVVAVEAHKGGKAAVLRRLEKEAAAPAEAEAAKVTALVAEAKAVPAPAKAKKAPAKAEKVTAAPAKTVTAGARAIPAEAANAERQAYLTEVGMDRYRQQYNAGWDAATAGQGAKKAATGTASVAWMDGFTDRTANPGKAGIASKWAALRSDKAPVAKVEAPEAPAAAQA